MRKIKTPSNERMKKKVYLDVDEVKEIEKNVSSGNTKRSRLYLSQWNERDEAIINLGFHKALRVSAIISINIDDINWEDNAHMFLSKRAIYSFGGYASQQLRRTNNKAARLVGQTEREQHILSSINNAYYTFPEKYFSFPEDSIKLYIDKSHQEDFDTEIYMDINLKHYPLRDYKSMWSEMNNIVKDYSKIGKRNKHAVENGKLSKHMMHLVRLYYMCFDILENEKIITYREKEHDLLMDIRNGKYLDENKQPIPEFFEMVDELEKRLKYDAENTSLPDSPDYKKINEFVMSVNERIVKGEI